MESNPKTIAEPTIMNPSPTEAPTKWTIRLIGSIPLCPRPETKTKSQYQQLVVAGDGIDWSVNGGVLITKTLEPPAQAKPFWLPYSKIDSAFQE